MFFGWLKRILLSDARILLGLGYWSLSAFLKHSSKKAVNFISDFEQGIVEYIHQDQCHGVIAGHVHHPAITIINGVIYANCGDFVENLTAIVETMDGNLLLINCQNIEHPLPQG